MLCGHLIEPVSGTYDVVVANILTDVIVELLDHVVSALNPAGLFICSGILEARRHTVACKMAACGFHVADELARDEWVGPGRTVDDMTWIDATTGHCADYFGLCAGAAGHQAQMDAGQRLPGRLDLSGA
jgi:hypothetical protein